MHTAGDAQSPSVVQEFLQTAAPHWYGKQGAGVGRHALAGPVAGRDARERRRARRARRALAGRPLRVQLAGRRCRRTCRWSHRLPVPLSGAGGRSGSTAPAGTFVQVPADVGSAQDWHLPSQRELQQTPCAQKPVTHSASAGARGRRNLQPARVRNAAVRLLALVVRGAGAEALRSVARVRRARTRVGRHALAGGVAGRRRGVDAAAALLAVARRPDRVLRAAAGPVALAVGPARGGAVVLALAARVDVVGRDGQAAARATPGNAHE